MTLLVDFDGTLHTGTYPGIGAPAPHAIEMMQKLKADGHRIIIWTCREQEDQEAMVEWLAEHKIPYDQINEHDPEMLKNFHYESRKVYADIYIDDRNLGGLPSWREIYDIVSGKVKPYWIYKILK